MRMAEKENRKESKEEVLDEGKVGKVRIYFGRHHRSALVWEGKSCTGPKKENAFPRGKKKTIILLRDLKKKEGGGENRLKWKTNAYQKIRDKKRSGIVLLPTCQKKKEAAKRAKGGDKSFDQR